MKRINLNRPSGREKKFVYLKGSRFEVTPDGLFHCPGGACSGKKHSCPDCHFCQWCSHSRCSLCRSQQQAVLPSAHSS